MNEKKCCYNSKSANNQCLILCIQEYFRRNNIQKIVDSYDINFQVNIEERSKLEMKNIQINAFTIEIYNKIKYSTIKIYASSFGEISENNFNLLLYILITNLKEILWNRPIYLL